MRLLVAFIYCSFVLILTCTQSITKLAVEGRPSFQWNPDPDFIRFFDFQSYPFHSQPYLTQKSGHIIAFFFLAFLIHLAVRKGSIGLFFLLLLACLLKLHSFISQEPVVCLMWDMMSLESQYILYFIPLVKRSWSVLQELKVDEMQSKKELAHYSQFFSDIH